MSFEWDETKKQSNLIKHGVDFAQVMPLFDSESECIDIEDVRENYGEERRVRIGLIEGVAFYVVYTLRTNGIRVISARLAGKAELKILREKIKNEHDFSKGICIWYRARKKEKLIGISFAPFKKQCQSLQRVN